MMSNKKLFLDLALEQKEKGNRLGKAFNVVGWEKIIKAFNEKMVCSLSSYSSRTFTANKD